MPQNFSAFNNPLIPKVTPVTQVAPTPMVTQPAMNTGAPQTIPTQIQCNIIYVDGMDDVLSRPTGPNEQTYFAEKETNIMWIRETDGTGQIKNPIHKITCTYEDVPFGPEANFVTKEEYNKLYELVANMSKNIETISSQLS